MNETRRKSTFLVRDEGGSERLLFVDEFSPLIDFTARECTVALLRLNIAGPATSLEHCCELISRAVTLEETLASLLAAKHADGVEETLS